MKKVIKIVLNSLFYLITAFIIVCLVITTVQRVRKEQPRLFGYSIYVIQTDSMTSEIEVGEAILSKKNAKYEIGSVITYIATEGLLKGQPITHKIVDIYEEDGVTMIQTRGVKQGATNDRPITEDQIEGVMIRKLNVSKSVTSFIQKPYAMFAILIIPISLYAISQLYHIIFYKKEE